MMKATCTLQLFLLYLSLLHSLADGKPFEESGSRRECGKGNRQFKKNHVYYYMYEGRVESGIGGITDELATLEVNAKLSFRYKAGCTYSMQIHNVQLTEKLGNADKSKESKTKQWLQNELVKNPLLFTLDQGLVLDIRPELRERDKVVLNLKRSMLSPFQLKWAKVSDGIETDISGSCSVSYKKLKGERTRRITKTRDLKTCKDRSMTHSVVESVQYAEPLSWYDTSSVCDYRLRTKNEIETIACKEEFLMKPFSASAKSGGYVKSSQNVTLLRTRRNKRKALYEDFYVSSLLYEHEHPDELRTRKEWNNRQDQAEDILKNLAKSSVKAIQPNTAEQFSNLVASLRYLDQEELQDLVESSGSCFDHEECDVKLRLAFGSFLFDALAQCGSTPCVRVLSATLRTNDDLHSSLRHLVSSMALIQEPTMEMIDIITDLHQDLKDPSILALLGTILNKLCIHKSNECEKMDAVRHAEEHLLRELGNDCTVKDASKANVIFHALKAIGNAGRPLKARKLVMDCALNAAHVNVSIAALHALKRMEMNEDLKDILYELVTDKNADTERRMEAFFLLMDGANADDALLVIDMVNDDGDAGQLRSLMYSYIKNILRTSDPARLTLKEDFLTALELRNLTDFDVPISRFSKFNSLSFYLDGIQVGATADSMMFFHPESFIPRTLRLNLTSNLFGNAINVMGVDLRMEGLEMLAAKILKPGGYLSGSYLEKIFTIPVDILGQQAMEERQRKRRDLGLWPSYRSRLEELANEVNLKEPSPQLALGIKVFGRELSLMTLNDISPIMEGFERFNVIYQLYQLSQGVGTSIQRNIFFLESQYVVPTILGFPLKLHANGSAVVKLGIQGTVNLENFMSATPTLVMNGGIEPSMSIDLSGRLTVDGYFSKIGVHVNSSIYSSSRLGGKLRYTADSEFDVDVDVPQEPIQLFNVSQNVFHVAGDSEVPVKGSEKEAKVDLCSSDLFKAKEYVGLDLCSEVSFPVAFHEKDVPFYPLTGASRMGLVIVPRDKMLTKYNIHVKKEKDVYKIKLSSPGSSIPRDYPMEVGISASEKTGVIGATFGKFRKGIMLRYEYDDLTHSVKVQLNSNLTGSALTFRGHYFNSTHPVSLEKKIGYEIGVQSKNLDIYNKLQFQDTYEFWAIESLTTLTDNSEIKLRFQIQYEPQVISLSFKNTRSSTTFYWQLKPGFPSMSSYLNVTHRGQLSLYGSGMIDLQNLVGEGELSTSPTSHYMKGKFQWINKKESKGISAQAIWKDTVVTLNSVFNLKGEDRLLTSTLEIGEQVYSSSFQFNKTSLNLDLNANGYPMRIMGDLQNKLNYRGMKLTTKLPYFEFGLQGGTENLSPGSKVCINATLNGTNYDNCVTTVRLQDSKSTSIQMRHGSFSSDLHMKKEDFEDGTTYKLGMTSNEKRWVDLTVEKIVDESGKSNTFELSLPVYGILATTKASSDPGQQLKTYSIDVEKTQPGTEGTQQFQFSADHSRDNATGMTNSSFTFDSVALGQWSAEFWTVHGLPGETLPSLASPIQKSGMSLTSQNTIMSLVYVNSSIKAQLKRLEALPDENNPLSHASNTASDFEAFFEYKKMSHAILKLSRTSDKYKYVLVELILIPKPMLRIKLGKGSKPEHVSEITVVPSVERGYSVLTFKHPITKFWYHNSPSKIRSLKNRAVARFEQLFTRMEKSFAKYENVNHGKIRSEIHAVFGDKVDGDVRRKLLDFASRSYTLIKSGARGARQGLRTQIRQLFDVITNSGLTNTEMLALEKLLNRAKEQSMTTKTEAGKYIRELLEIVLELTPEVIRTVTTQKEIKNLILSTVNSSVSSYLSMHNVPIEHQKKILHYLRSAVTIFLPLLDVTSPSQSVDLVLMSLLNLIKTSDVNVTDVYVTLKKKIIDEYISSKQQLPTVSLAKKLVTVLANSIVTVAKTGNWSVVAINTYRDMTGAVYDYLLELAGKELDTPTSTKLKTIFVEFLSDLNATSLFRKLVKFTATTLYPDVYRQDIVDKLLSAKDAYSFAKTLAGIIVHHKTVDNELKKIFGAFLIRPDMKVLAHNLILFGIDRVNVSTALKTAIIQVVKSNNAKIMTKRLGDLLFATEFIPKRYREILADLGTRSIEVVLKNLTRTLLTRLEKIYVEMYPSGIYSTLLGKGIFEDDGLKTSPLLSLLAGLENDVRILLKEKDASRFANAIFRRLLRTALDISSKENTRILRLAKTKTLLKLNELTTSLLDMLPDESIRNDVQNVCKEFISVVETADFTLAERNVTRLIQHILEGWTNVLGSSKTLHVLLDGEVSEMIGHFADVIHIGNMSLSDIYNKLMEVLHNRGRLAAEIFGQFSRDKYDIFQQKYMVNKKIDFYKIYQDLLNTNLTGTVFSEVDQLMGILSNKLIQEIKSRTGNYNVAVLANKVLDAIINTNNSDINDVLNKYRNFDYAKYSNFSVETLRDLVIVVAQRIESLNVSGKHIGDHLKEGLLVYADYLARGSSILTTRAQQSFSGMEKGYMYLDVARMNTTALLSTLMSNLRENFRSNPKLQQVVESLGFPLFTSFLKFLKETRLGNSTVYGIWKMALTELERRPDVSKEEISNLWYITRQLTELQEASSVYAAFKVVNRIVDAAYQLSINSMKWDLKTNREYVRLINASMKFMEEFVRDNVHLPLVQFISKAVKESREFAYSEFQNSFLLQLYYKTVWQQLVGNFVDLQGSEKLIANETHHLYKKVTGKVNGFLESNSLHNTVPLLVRNVSGLASKVLKTTLRCLDKARMVVRNIEFLRDFRSYVGAPFSVQLKSAVRHWRKVEDSAFQKLHALENRVRGNLRQLDRSKYMKQALESSLRGSDAIIGNISANIKRGISAIDQYLKQMKTQFTRLSEEYIYRLFLNWDVLVSRISNEFDKLYKGKEHLKDKSLIQLTDQLSQLLRKWRRTFLGYVHLGLRDYFRELSKQVTVLRKQKFKSEEIINAIRTAVAKNISQFLQKIAKSEHIVVNNLMQVYNSSTVFDAFRGHFHKFMNMSGFQTWEQLIKGWRLDNGSLSVIIPWAPNIQTLFKGKDFSRSASALEPQGIPYGKIPADVPMAKLEPVVTSAHVIEMQMSKVKEWITSAINRAEQLAQRYNALISQHSQFFSSLAARYHNLVDNISINATEYVYHVYQKRFLKPFKESTDRATIAPVDSVPPMPTLPGVWDEMTSIFKPITRTAVVYGRHIFTFDGRYVHTALPSSERQDCTYVLARDFRRGKFTLLYQENSIIVESEDTKVVFRKDEKMDAFEKLDSNSDELSGPYSDTPLEIGDTVITKNGPTYKVKSRFGFEVHCNVKYLLCNFTLSGFYHNKTLGLFGTNNEEYADDLRLPGGRIAVDMMEFLNEWELTQSDSCYLHSQDDFYSCRRLPPPNCREAFKLRNSTLSRAFRYVNPSPFLDACEYETSKCDDYSSRRHAHCPFAAAYVQLASSQGVNVPYPRECAHCDEHKYGNRLPTNRMRRQLKAVDIVLLIRLSENMEHIVPTLKTTLRKVQDHLEFSGMNVQYRVVGFEGEGYRFEPHSQTGNTEDVMSFSDLEEALENLEFEGDNSVPERQGLKALRFAVGLPLRPLATKIFIMLENDKTYSSRLRELIATNDLLERDGVILNAINAYDMKRGVIGKSSTGKRYHVKIPKGEQLRSPTFPPSDDYIPLVRETGGAILTLRGLSSADEKFRKAFPVSLSSIIYQQVISDLQLCKECRCQQNTQGFGSLKCVKSETKQCR